ncbi:kinase-like domain-containing protein [Lineolata rhizophorae]|uniref:Kinase-like domain-containing protein n=1 Tax=Lineolata rhizophorae TaxID=578093 RepID=A0A6A6PD98_9PEZI|nr:kinase-like domain-containing protein [Lineolata rhizophorae]
MERAAEISVERLSGALTNAVYVVSPPKNLPPRTESANSASGETNQTPAPAPVKPPNKLLLRIYGPQVEHLIDRDAELQILQRLARKNIGPRLLGTFKNGRFEEFFHARALNPADLRNPDISRQIAKRMRELHEGIELLPEERERGPYVWQNWDKWVERCEKVITYVDRKTREENRRRAEQANGVPYRKREFVCGVEWTFFKETVDKYRAWLDEKYGGPDRLRDRLVFAHNDTQYGNILRLVPAGESPLLLPANQHKRLIVIDFEYANANMPGLEFANHFVSCVPFKPPSLPPSLPPTHSPRISHAFLLHGERRGRAR